MAGRLRVLTIVVMASALQACASGYVAPSSRGMSWRAGDRVTTRQSTTGRLDYAKQDYSKKTIITHSINLGNKVRFEFGTVSYALTGSAGGFYKMHNTSKQYCAVVMLDSKNRFSHWFLDPDESYGRDGRKLSYATFNAVEAFCSDKKSEMFRWEDQKENEHGWW